MVRTTRAIPVLLASFLLAVAPDARGRTDRAIQETCEGGRPDRKAVTLLSNLALHLEENRGQGEPDALFIARRNGWQASLLAGGVRFELLSGTGAVVTQRLHGALAGAKVEGIDPLPGRSNFFQGNDPAKWISDVPHFGAARVHRILPGVDMVWRGLPGGRLRYDFELEAGADPSTIRLDFEGARVLRSGPDGSLRVDTPEGSIHHSAPVAWQESPDGRRRPVECSSKVEGNSVRYILGPVNRGLPLVIDPAIEVSTFVGGGDSGLAYGAAVDQAGNMLVAGETRVNSFPTKNAYQSTRKGSDDFYIAKFASGGSTLVWSTYFGGTQQDRCYSLALGPDESVYVCGYTNDNTGTFPLKNAIQTSFGGVLDAVVAKFGPNGNTLDYSTLLGGSNLDQAFGIAVDSSGQARVVGSTNSTNFPLAGAIRSTAASNEAFLVKLSASGSSLQASTYLGGSGSEGASGVALDVDGNAWIVGASSSSDLPMVSAIQGSLSGTNDSFIMKVNAGHSSILFSTYYGGSGQESGNAIALGEDGSVFFGGQTLSANFPIVNARQGTMAGSNDGFIVKIDAAQLAVKWATFLGGGSGDQINGLATDPDGGVIAVGTTSSSDFPTASPTQGSRAGADEMFLSRLSSDGASLTFSTYHGSTADDMGLGVAANGDLVLIVGSTRNADFPSVDGRGETIVGQVASAFAGFHLLPVQMGNLQAVSVSGNRVDLTWTDTHSGAYGIRIQRRLGTASWADVANLDPGTTSWSDTTVLEDGFYEYRIRGTSGSGDTAWTQGMRVRTPVFAPGSPAAAAPSNNLVNVTWMDLSLVETAYEVSRRTGLSGAFDAPVIRPAGSIAFGDATVLPETTYSYFVTTRAPSGGKSDSAVVVVTTPPANPTNLQALTVSDVEARLLWQDHSSAESEFEIQRRDDDASGAFVTIGTAIANATTRSDIPLAAGHGYSYRIRAVNGNGASDWTASASMRTAPAAPVAVTGVALATDRISVTWTDLAAGETGYTLQRKAVSEGSFLPLAGIGPNAEGFEDATALQETSYVYRVRSFDPGGASRWTESAEIRTPSQLVIGKAFRRPAKGKKPFSLTVTGTFDHGMLVPPDFAAGVSLMVGGATYDIPALVEAKGVFSFENDGIRFSLKPAKGGRSSVAFTLLVEGAVAETTDPEGELSLSLTLGGFKASGVVQLSGGSFDPKKGLGAWTTPSLWVTAFKASVAKPGAHTLSLSASFAPVFPAPTSAPDVALTIGDGNPMVLDGSLFVPKGGKWVLKVRDGSSWDATYDPAKGTFSLKGKQLDLGQYTAGTVAVRIDLAVGDLRFVDTPILVTNGKTLAY